MRAEIFLQVLCMMLIKSFLSLYYEGRNKGLKGLASAILKLWEKSLIAKIAIKYGIPNIDNEMMATELKASLI